MGRASWIRWWTAAIAAAVAVACGGGAREGDATGVVRAVGPDRTHVTLEHGEIPGLMQAMTMEFAVASPQLLAGVEPGERVEFRVRYADGTYTVTELRETAR